MTEPAERLTEDEVLKLLALIELLAARSKEFDGDRADTLRKRLLNALREALRGS